MPEEKYVREWRVDAGYTSKKCADELMIERDTYTRKEKTHKFSVKQKCRLACLFGIKPSQILD